MDTPTMNEKKRMRIRGIAIVPLTLLMGCDIALPGTGGVSDVPCFRPTAWPEGSTTMLVRADSGASLLMTHRTREQVVEDRHDQILGNDAHGPVYRFDATAETFELVDDQVWDDATGMVIGCTGQEARESPFVLERTGGSRMLFFDRREIPVAGGNAVSIWDQRDGKIVAVISSSGGGGIPLISNISSSGQHYHQLFSEVDGEPVGEPLRLPFAGAPGPPRGCWSPDGGFVLYCDLTGEGRFDRICVVDVRDLVPQPGSEDAPAGEGGDESVGEQP